MNDSFHVTSLMSSFDRFGPDAKRLRTASKSGKLDELLHPPHTDTKDAETKETGTKDSVSVLISTSGASENQAAPNLKAPSQSPLQGHDFIKEGRRARAAKAMENLERLVKEGRMLQLLGGDPKLRAHAAADLAKRIGEALKDYAVSADKDSAATPSTAVPAAAGTQDTGTQDTGAENTGAEVTGTQDTAPVDAKAAPVDAKAAPADAKAAPADAKAAPVDAKAAPVDAKAADKTTAAERAAVEGTALLGKLGPPGAQANERIKAMAKEKQFLNTVKAMLNALRGIVERGIEAEEHEHGRKGGTKSPEAEANGKKLDEAGKALEEALKSIGHHGEGEPGGLAIATCGNDPGTYTTTPGLNLTV